jgi:hypothetical protein
MLDLFNGHLKLRYQYAVCFQCCSVLVSYLENRMRWLVVPLLVALVLIPSYVSATSEV